MEENNAEKYSSFEVINIFEESNNYFEELLISALTLYLKNKYLDL